MEIYIALVIYVLLLPLIVAPFCRNEDSRNRAIAFWGVLAIYLLLALKGDVGVDIAGYRYQYLLSELKAWTNIDYVYFEPGYITLTKLFSKVGISFQGFMACVYAVACTALYLFIRKYSKDPSFSILIFTCYQFFVFYNSGVRQTIALSLCIFAYIACDGKRRNGILCAVLLQLAAITMHASSIVFVIPLLYTRVRSKTISISRQMVLLGVAVFMRPYIWRFVNTYVRNVDINANIVLGGSFIMLCIIALFMYFTHSTRNFLNIRLKARVMSHRFTDNNAYFTRMIFYAVFANIVLSGGALLRSAMYYTLFLIPGLPNTIYCLSNRNRYIVKAVFVVLFVALFYFDTLAINQLEICPYVFFWE